jgi:hypothetical protein
MDSFIDNVQRLAINARRRQRFIAFREVNRLRMIKITEDTISMMEKTNELYGIDAEFVNSVAPDLDYFRKKLAELKSPKWMQR